MKLKQSLSLLTKGYTVDDVKALSKIEGITEDTIQSIIESGTSFADVKALMDIEREEPKPEGTEPTEPEGNDEPDYKALYEKAQEDLKKAQKDNINEDKESELPAERTAEEIFAEWLKDTF